MSNQEKRVDRGSRLIAASPSQVYEAFLDAQALIAWLPPDGAKGRIHAFEARVGGPFRMTLTFDDESNDGKTTQNTDVVKARFVELVPNARVRWAIDFDSNDPSFKGKMTMIWSMRPDGSGTRVSVAAHDVPSGIDAEDHEKAIESSLAHLAAHVEGR